MILMTIHITDLRVEGCKGVCIYNCRRLGIPIRNGLYKKEYLKILVRCMAE